MDDLDQYVEKRKAKEPEFRQAWEEGAADLEFQKAIVGARLAAGFSQRQLAERIGTSQSAVARMEAGTYRPRVETLLRLAEALQVTFEVGSSGVRVRSAA